MARKLPLGTGLACALFALSTFTPAIYYAQDADKKVDHPAVDKKKENSAPLPKDKVKNPIIWHDPGNIAVKNLYYGQGGDTDLPKPPFTFEDEDTGGTSPKLDLRDASGKKWHIKVSPETRPEVVASRLMWAVGFYANDDYVLPDAQVEGVMMKRGDAEVKRGHFVNARFSRKPAKQDKIGIWEWKDNPFLGTREFNGLRVMMAVMNNWDLKDENNSVYIDKKTNKQIFLVNDVGATFGTNGISFTKSRSVGNEGSFKNSEFIIRKTDTEVDFATPRRPTAILLATAGATAKSYAMRRGLDAIGHKIPVADARWMGSLLGQLSHEQLVDAFRAGNFPQDVVVEYVTLVENRIQVLKGL